MNWVRSRFCYKTGHTLVYIISHSLASSHPSPEFRSLQCTCKSRSFPTPSDELASKRQRPLCLWGQWSNSRPAANSLAIPFPPLVSFKQTNEKTQNKKLHICAAHEMNSFLGPQVEHFQIARIRSHEGTRHPPFRPTRILQILSNTIWRSKFQRCSHHFWNNDVFRSSMPLANILNEAHLRTNSQAFFATEWTLNWKYHTIVLLKRQKRWMTSVEVPYTFHTQTHSI